MRWIYTAVVRPMITYGSVAWVGGLRYKYNLKRLKSVQGMACRMITGSMRSTPIAGMEVLLGLTPIDIFVKETAVATSTRLARAGHWRESVRRPLCAHTTITNDIRDSIPEINFPQDKSWFKVKIDNALGSRNCKCFY